MQTSIRLILRVAPYLLVAVVLLYGMLTSFPADDDVLFEYLIALHGPESLNPGLLDRPVSGWIWTPLAQMGTFWWPQIIANLVSWLILGMISAWLFQWVFPEHRRAAVAAGLFTMSPLFVEMHFIIANAYIPVHALSQLPIVLLLKDYRHASARWLALTLALIGVGAASLVSEYAVAAAAGTSVLLLAKAYFSNDPRARRRDLVSVVLLVAVAFAGYAVFAALRDPNFRPGVDSSNLFSEGIARFAKLPFRLVSALYTGTAGALLRELADINVNSNETVLGTLFGLILMGVALLSMRATPTKDGARERPFGGYEWLVLLAAFAAALMPALLMGRRPDDETFSSRFFFPTLPLASVLTVAFLRQMIAGHRDWLVVAIISFVAGFAVLSQALVSKNVTEEMIGWGDAIRPYVDEQGMTVAVVLLGRDKFDGFNLADDLLTSRIGLNWPVELRRHFYATNALDELGPAESSARRGALLEYPISRVLLVVPKGVGSGVIISEIELDHLPKKLLDFQNNRRKLKSPPVK